MGMLRLFLTLLLAISAASLTAQSDLDALMERVLARRDENWKKLQQYILDERETFRLVGPAEAPLYGFDRDYTWFLRDGIFVRSPIRADGVVLSEEERRHEEAQWLAREQRRDNPEPRFLSYAYFLRFKFDPGQYALVGRERLDGRDVLRIEYYPTKLFTEGRARPNRRLRDRDDDIEAKMNKAAVVTLWVEPNDQQIVRYEMDDLDMDFLPGASLVRVDEVDASMRMTQPFAGVWLPAAVSMRFRMQSAAGAVSATYDVEYHDYREADVKVRVR
jgi:hypothetical protein